MAEPFLGEIAIVGFHFNPRGWANCDGQLLPISQNTALFSLFGTNYGGDGRTTFALPDLQSRAPIHYGSGAGLTSYPLGARGGEESVTLTGAQIPAHTHSYQQSVTDSGGSQTSPANGGPAVTEQLALYRPQGDADLPGNAAVANNGSGSAHTNMPPFLTLRFIVALHGTFPSRS